MSNTIEGSLDQAATKKILAEYKADKTNVVVRHAISRTTLANATYDSSAASATGLVFSHEIKTMPVTNQKSSGRCWIFAGLNVLRETIAKKLNIKAGTSFEVSQNYLSLYDKIEKANFTLESIISLAQYSPNERVFQFILDNPVSDGGQWDMFVNLVKKYGLVPKDCFPETFHSNNTRETNFMINAIIRQFAYQAHELCLKGKKSEVRPLKDKAISEIYQFCLNAFGVPPQKFDFEWEDAKGKFHKETHTAKSFFDKYVGKEIDEYQSLINSPTEDKPYLRNFTIDYLGNVLEGKPINHLNLEMDDLKDAIIRQLMAGEVVWFGSDVGFYRDRDSFVWDDKAFDYLGAFKHDVKFDKGAMLDFRHSAMNHAMVIVGVDIDDGIPTKWKIENSWGDSSGAKGYYVMSDSWFDRFVYQAVVKNKYLTKEQQAAAKKAPIHLNPWDPMGTLAD
ncbi:MAG: C1 family peptidase [Bacilli bacterium]|nr:C1 family peptidase [Bacilli bacterium]